MDYGLRLTHVRKPKNTHENEGVPMMLLIVMPLISREPCRGNKVDPNLAYIVAKINFNCNSVVRIGMV